MAYVLLSHFETTAIIRRFSLLAPASNGRPSTAAAYSVSSGVISTLTELNARSG